MCYSGVKPLKGPVTMSHASRAEPFSAAARRPALLYRQNEVNHCPGCGGTAWIVGRATAQCVRCDTALPLILVASQPNRPLFTTRGRGAALCA